MTLAEALAASGIDLPEARLLLAAASGHSRAVLAAHPEYILGANAEDAFLEAAARRRRGEPVAYILGEREFYSLTFAVSPDVLIPRPETEMLVDFALEHLPDNGSLLDLGTGSGAIAISVKHERPDTRVTAVDFSAAALGVARANAARHGLEVRFMQGDWFAAVGGERFDVVVSNPPYVAAGDHHLQQGDLRFEPPGALAGGADGLESTRRIVAAAGGHLNAGGWVGLEHGAGQDAAVRDLLAAAGLESVFSRPDLAGIARISVGKYNLE
ncbi:MAG: peptide chain release factor N(5)-glutamine methyltransferase [Betaproteobacteria bacterium]